MIFRISLWHACVFSLDFCCVVVLMNFAKNRQTKKKSRLYEQNEERMLSGNFDFERFSFF